MDNAYYLRKYGITLARRQEMEKECGGVCEICGRPPKKNALAVDHDHKLKYLKIFTIRFKDKGEPDMWVAEVDEPRIGIARNKRNEAIRLVRQELKTRSVRGLVCWRCNNLLRKAGDNPELLESAAKYLRRFQARFQNVD